MFDRAFDRLEQGVVGKWLLQKIDSAGFHRLHRDRDVALSRHHDDRQPEVPLMQPPQQLQAIDLRHSDIRQNAIDTDKALGQERLGAGMRPNREARRR